MYLSILEVRTIFNKRFKISANLNMQWVVGRSPTFTVIAQDSVDVGGPDCFLLISLC